MPVFYQYLEQYKPEDFLFDCTPRNLEYVLDEAGQKAGIRSVQVGAGFDVADNEIVKRVSAGDLVITSDLPLAAEVIEKSGHVLSHRGEWYSAANIGPLLNMRDFMDNLRASGVDWDLRRDQPVGLAWDQVEWNVITHPDGDSL